MSDDSSPPPVSTGVKVCFALLSVVVIGAFVYVVSFNDPAGFEEIKQYALYAVGGLVFYIVSWYVNRWLGFPFGHRYPDHHSTSWQRYEDSHAEPDHPFDLRSRPRGDYFGVFPDGQTGEWYPTATGRTEMDQFQSPFDAVERWKCGYCGGWNPEERKACIKCQASYDGRVLNSVEKAEKNSRKKRKQS